MINSKFNPSKAKARDMAFWPPELKASTKIIKDMIKYNVYLLVDLILTITLNFDSKKEDLSEGIKKIELVFGKSKFGEELIKNLTLMSKPDESSRKNFLYFKDWLQNLEFDGILSNEPKFSYVIDEEK